MKADFNPTPFQMASICAALREHRNVIDYTIITADEPTALADMVNKAIDDGWCPSGGVSVALSESDDYKYVVWAQAVVRNG